MPELKLSWRCPLCGAIITSTQSINDQIAQHMVKHSPIVIDGVDYEIVDGEFVEVDCDTGI